MRLKKDSPRLSSMKLVEEHILAIANPMSTQPVLTYDTRIEEEDIVQYSPITQLVSDPDCEYGQGKQVNHINDQPCQTEYK